MHECTFCLLQKSSSFLHQYFLGPEDSNHKSGQYFCDECDVNFDKSTAYARHLYAHTFIKKASFIYCVSTCSGKGRGVRRWQSLLIFSTKTMLMLGAIHKLYRLCRLGIDDLLDSPYLIKRKTGWHNGRPLFIFITGQKLKKNEVLKRDC